MGLAVRDRGTSGEEITQAKVEALAYGPYGVARPQGHVVLIPRTAPGDEVKARIVARRANYAIGEPVSVVKPSSLRQEPPCPYFDACGGCPWQAVQYEAQLAAKQKNIEDALTRIGKLGGFELLPILPSASVYHYRRRVRLHADGQKRLGYYRAFSHELIEVDSCLVADPRADLRLGQARSWLKSLRTPVDQLDLVVGDQEDPAVFAGRARGRFARDDDSASSRFLEAHREIGGLILFGRDWRRCWGQGKVLIRLADDLTLQIDAELFSQVNPEGNLQLAREALAWGEFHPGDRVLELYCGAGNFTLPIAKRAGEIVAVEGHPRSIQNGRSNSRLNRLSNIRWICSPADQAVRELRRRGERFTKILLNPPRSGAKGLEDDLASLGAGKILYVSCEPPTLARDLAALGRKGYRATRIRPVDLFPHSYHVEVVAELVPSSGGSAPNPASEWEMGKEKKAVEH